MQLLHIDSSVLGPASVSRALSAEILAKQVVLRPDTIVMPQDLATDAALHLSPAAALEHHENYLTGVLSFMRLTDLTIMPAEGLALGKKAKEPAIVKARENIAATAT